MKKIDILSGCKYQRSEERKLCDYILLPDLNNDRTIDIGLATRANRYQRPNFYISMKMQSQIKFVMQLFFKIFLIFLHNCRFGIGYYKSFFNNLILQISQISLNCFNSFFKVFRHRNNFNIELLLIDVITKIFIDALLFFNELFYHL